MKVGVWENVSEPLPGKQREQPLRAATELPARPTKLIELSLGAHRSFFKNGLSGVLQLSVWR